MTQLDRIEEMIRVLFDGRAGQKGHPMDRKGDAPARPVPVPGFEKVFGPKPKPGTPGYYEWVKQVPKVTAVTTNIPEDIEEGAMAFVAATQIIPVFVEYEGKWLAALSVKPEPWLVEFDRFVGDNVQGLIRAAKGSEKK